MTRGMTEIIRLGIALGAEKETLSGLSGMGDLIVTCTSMHSRNRRAGILIGKGLSAKEAQLEIGMVVEGISSLKPIYELSKEMNIEMPITEKAYEIVFEGKNPAEAVFELMTREPKDE
jgi:glycerol-3-phosphate dehydrogenase (NAD(P)+)